MIQAIYPFFEWCEKTPIFAYISTHEYAFPAIETFHIFGLTLLLGSVIILSLRLMRVVLKAQPVDDLAKELLPYLDGGLALMLASGVFLFIATAVRNYGNTSFWVKMGLLALALVFHFLYFRRVIQRQDQSESHGRIAAIAALLLWLGVGVAGRSIGFFG